jgi:hypothetical protein
VVKALYDKRARGEKEHDSLALHYRWLGGSWQSALHTGRLVHSTTLHAERHANSWYAGKGEVPR